MVVVVGGGGGGGGGKYCCKGKLVSDCPLAVRHV